MDKIILSFFPGVGDVCQFSTLPRRFAELGHRVFISNRSTYRNADIGKLVWELNPFISGISEDAPNCGDGALVNIDFTKHDTFLGCWEAAHGLPEPYSKYPELYYTPKIIKELADKTLIDVTSTSGKNIYEAEPIRKYINEHTNKEDSLVCTFNNGIAFPMLLVDGYPCVFSENIFHYCDLIASCKKFVVLHSGGMVIASALQKYKPITCDCLVTFHPIHVNGYARKHHFYDNINYIWI